MWHNAEYVALQKLFDTKFDSNLDDILDEDEIEAIRNGGGTALKNLGNRIIVPIHNKKVYLIIILVLIRKLD